MTERQRWTVFAVMLAVLAGGIAVVALAGGGDDGGDGGALTVEQSFVPGTRQPELLVSVKPELNVADTAENGRTVGLECRDSAKRLVINARVEWPWIEEPGYALPHTHQPATAKELSSIETCRVTGVNRRLVGRMRLRSN